MPDRKMEITLNEQLARRLAARAADQGKDLNTIVVQQLTGWLGEWGLRTTSYVVQPGDSLSSIALRFYRDASKATVIAAFNDIANPSLIHVGQLLFLPEAGAQEPLPKGESPFLFGLHDRGGEYLMGWAGRKGWVLCTEELGADRNDWGSRSYSDLADGGYGVIVRLNHGYGERGTLPRSERYEDFAMRVGNFVERSAGCHIWVIGNEPNLAYERPGGPDHGEAITPDKYVAAYRACRREILRRSGHSTDQVVVAAVGPWNIQTTYPSNPGGDWVVYFQDILNGLAGDIDGIAIHTYARDANPANITSEAHMDPPYNRRRSMFRTYIDWMEAIPASLRSLPVYLTEVNQNTPWANVNAGWVQEAYAEINRWNTAPDHQKVRCVILYRWERYDQWQIRDKSEVVNDFRAALQHDYRWRN